MLFVVWRYAFVAFVFFGLSLSFVFVGGCYVFVVGCCWLFLFLCFMGCEVSNREVALCLRFDVLFVAVRSWM